MASSPLTGPVDKSAPPVNILLSPIARVYSFVHPVLLLGLCGLRFQALVANPAQELLADLPWLVLLQMTYVTVCLPPAGSTDTGPLSAADSEEKKKSAPRSPSGPSVRPVKPGYRRKQQTGKHDWAGKMMVWRDVGLSIVFHRADRSPIARLPLARTHLSSSHSGPGHSPRPFRCPAHYT